MRNLYNIFVLMASVVGFSISVFAAAEDSCDCPKLSCNSDCEIEQDLTFYSEKCEGGKRVKSCARPTCIPIQNAPATCGAAKSDVKSDSVVASRVPASATKEAEVVGKINFVEGTVKKVVSADKKINLTVGDEVSEGDRIETDVASKAQILFNSGNQLNLTPNSVVVITEANDTKDSNKKRVVLDLIKGRVRSKVNQSYNGEQSYYRVRAGAAVAGVRGTDFVVTLDTDDKNVTSKIEALEGKVELSDSSFEQKAMVTRGEASSYVAPKDAIFNDKDKAEFVAKGYLTPVYKMTSDQIAELQKDTNFSMSDSKNMLAKNKVKTVKSVDLPICASPSGRLNECAWTCENNPLGESRCRTDMPDVSCVRRICNANGVWSQPTRLPAAHRESCKGSAPVIKPCDY